MRASLLLTRPIQEASGTHAKWTTFIDKVEKEFVGTSFWRHVMHKLFVAAPRARRWSGRLPEVPGVTIFREAVTKCRLGAGRFECANTPSLHDRDLMICCCMKGTLIIRFDALPGGRHRSL